MKIQKDNKKNYVHVNLSEIDFNTLFIIGNLGNCSSFTDFNIHMKLNPYSTRSKNVLSNTECFIVNLSTGNLHIEPIKTIVTIVDDYEFKVTY